MNRKIINMLLFLAMISLGLSVVPYYFYYSTVQVQDDKYTIVDYSGLKKLEPGQKFAVKMVKILDGNSFEFLLEGDVWIKAVVPIIPQESAYSFVVDILPKVQNPTVLLKGQYKSIWIVEFNFMLDGKATRLDSVLKENHLVFE